jgi:hypothetical protein
VPIRVPAGGEDMSVVTLGKRQEKFGGVAGSENDECMTQDQLYPERRVSSVPARSDQSPTKKVILFCVRISSCYTRNRHFTLDAQEDLA